MIGSRAPRTLASPRIQLFAPGTRVSGAGTPSTSRASSRATRYSSPAIFNATPTQSPAAAASVPALAVTERPRRSSSASSSKGRSRSARSVEVLFCMSGRERRLGLLDQLVRRYRLDQIIDRALAQPPGPIGLLALRGHHDDRNRAGVRI